MQNRFRFLPTLLTLALTFSFAFDALPVQAMEGGTVGMNAEFRWRGEEDGKDFNADTDLGGFSWLRARMGTWMKYEDVKAYVQFQYPHQLGWNSSNSDEVDSLDVRQAYLQVHNLFMDGLSFKGGRFELKYGDERLIGPVGWVNIGRTFDGLKFRYDTDQFMADLFFTQQNERYDPDTASNAPDDFFAGVWAKHKETNLNIFAVNQGFAAPNANGDVQNNLSRSTLGLHYMKKYDSGLGALLDGAYQMGTKKTFGPTTETETDLAAWMVVLSVWYTMGATAKTTIGAGIDMASGDDPESEDKFEAFDNLYYTGHRWRGYMDYFVDSNPEGLRDIFIKVKHAPSEAFRLKLMFHLFAGMQPTNAGDDAISYGNEIDLVADYDLKENLMLGAGLGYFMPSEDWKGSDADAGLWAFLSLTATLKNSW